MTTVNPFARREIRLLVLLGLVAGCLWLFIEVADEVVEGEAHALDEAILLALRNPADPADPLGPLWLEETVRDLTALGSVVVMSLFTVSAAGFLLLQGRRRAALFVLTAVAGGMLASVLLKAGFDRPRPDLVPHGTKVLSTSFPSQHSMMSAVVYLTLGALLARMQPRRRLKAYLLGLALLLSILVGVSRVYLGVHWPSDVLAGWSAGAAWAVLCWLVVLWLQRGDEESAVNRPE